MRAKNSYKTLLHRHERNPILTPADWPYPVNSVFNPGATKLSDGTTLLLCRVEDRRGISHLCVARSSNGIDSWEIDKSPTLLPDPEKFPEEVWGIEDPRITFVPDLDSYIVAYTSYSKAGPGVSLAMTKDFVEYRRIGIVMPPDDKDAAVLPKKIGDRWALVHRPITGIGAHIWLSYSTDLKHWGNHKLIMPSRKGAWWDASKVGLSVPPIETKRGWLIMYHGVKQTSSGNIYRLGLALMDLKNPEKCLLRGAPWFFGPEESYEKNGDVSNVVFPCGYTLEDDGDTINIYYGAADTSIAFARGSLNEMLDWLDANGEPPENNDD
jgi:predicted GH43/DUF377 family glycosyl hydrolase